MRVALLALVLAACSTPPVPTDAWMAAPGDAGPGPDAETLRCETDCVPEICGVAGEADPCGPALGQHEPDRARIFCAGCALSCPDRAPTLYCETDHTRTCRDATDYPRGFPTCVAPTR